MSNPALTTLDEIVTELKGLVHNTLQQHTRRFELLTTIELFAFEVKNQIRAKTEEGRVVEESSDSPRDYDKDCTQLSTLVANMKPHELKFEILNDIEKLAVVMHAEEVRQGGYGRTSDTTTSISDSTSRRGRSSRGGGSRQSRWFSLGRSSGSAGTGK